MEYFFKVLANHFVAEGNDGGTLCSVRLESDGIAICNSKIVVIFKIFTKFLRNPSNFTFSKFFAHRYKWVVF